MQFTAFSLHCSHQYHLQKLVSKIIMTAGMVLTPLFPPNRGPNSAAMPAPGVCTSIIQARHRKDGYGNVDNPERFLNQDFQQLKQFCVSRGLRYVDDMFPPDRKSIGEDVLSPSDLSRVVWLRPAVSASVIL